MNIFPDTLREFRILVLMGLPHIGRVSIQKMLDKKLVSDDLISPHDFQSLINSFFPKIGDKLSTQDYLSAFNYAHKVLADCHQLGIRIIHPLDDLYPSQLRVLSSAAPVLLFAKGNLNLLNASSKVAIVGTRKNTVEGQKAAHQFSTDFTNKGFVIVSGLALGCDTVAHEACLAANGQTIAVLSSGLDQIYPKENAALAAQILENGCLLSEIPPFSKIAKGNFVERDRIQAGLSNGVIVIESTLDGGTIHTVKAAIKYKRPVACIKYHPQFESPSNAGNRQLIREQKAIGLSLENVEEFVELL